MQTSGFLFECDFFFSVIFNLCFLCSQFTIFFNKLFFSVIFISKSHFFAEFVSDNEQLAHSTVWIKFKLLWVEKHPVSSYFYV